MNTILVGNGFNVELGGIDYLNKAIISRFMKNAKTKDYSMMLYNGMVSNDEIAVILHGMYDELRKILDGKYDTYCITNEERKLLSVLKNRYSLSTKIDDVGMEDYFIILRLFHSKYKDEKDMIKNTHDGFCWQFLDAIYNEGHIQEIVKTVLPAYRDYLKKKFEKYNDIYTVNYDKTVEAIADKKVEYLHGSFETLLDQYDDNTPIGAYYKQKGEKNPVQKGTEHIYCNGIMGFSGTYKEEIINIMDNGQFGIENILRIYNNGMSVQELKKLEKLKGSSDAGEQLAFGVINAVISNPSLKMHIYPMKKFKNIKGELHLLGISPFNDEHIWNAILGNGNLTKIIYYYHSDKSRKEMEEHFLDKRIIYLPDTDFWGA